MSQFKPKEETRKELRGITRTQFHSILKRAAKPAKPSPK